MVLRHLVKHIWQPGVAAHSGGEILSADSRQVYRDMDIGTGKDLSEYLVDGRHIPHHLINIREAGERYHVNEFQKDFRRAFDLVTSRGGVPVMCGGTGFYIHSVLMGHASMSIPVNDELRASLDSLSLGELRVRFHGLVSDYQTVADVSTRKRLIRGIEISEFLVRNPDCGINFARRASDYEAIVFGLNPPLDLRRERITTRLNFRLANGLIEEVEQLLKKGLSKEALIYYGLEYKFVTLYLTGEMGYREMTQRLETEIHRFAKRQMTFFRKMEKDGIVINWLNTSCEVEHLVETVTAGYREFQQHKKQ